MLSVVIPCLNEEAAIGGCLEKILSADVAGEVLVVDGGSVDSTLLEVEKFGVRIISGPAGRGAQLAAGARQASGSWLLFVHADTKLGPGWATVVRRFMEKPDNRFRAGYFRFALEDPAPAARRLETMVDWRCRVFSLPYGDQGLLINTTFYESLGGFPKIPLMEDVALIRRIPRHRLEPLASVAFTSAKRYSDEGYLIRSIKNTLLLGLYFLGFSPKYLARLYYSVVKL